MEAPLNVVEFIVYNSVKTYDKVEEESLDGENYFLLNQMWGSHPTYQKLGRNQGWKEKVHDRELYQRDNDRDHDRCIHPYDRSKNEESSPINPEKFKSEDVLAFILMHVEETDKIVRELKNDFSQLN